jgi:hypothetical protein
MFSFCWATPPVVRFYLVAPDAAVQLLDALIPLMPWC